MYKNIDFNKLFNNESEFAKKYNHGKLTDNRIKEVEELLEYKLPKSYIELLKVQNGGYINKKYEKCWLTAIYGIGANDKSFYGLEEQFKLYKEEGEYPDIGIPFGETQSGGHDMYFMDYSSVGENGEPTIVRIDNEENNAKYFVAETFRDFIYMVYNGADIAGTYIEIEKNKKEVSENPVGEKQQKIDSMDNLKIQSIIVLCICIFMLIFFIPIKVMLLLIIDFSIIIFCIGLIIYSIIKKKELNRNN